MNNSDFNLHYDHEDDSNDGTNEDDDDLKKAIHNSLQTSKEESVDEDLNKAIQLSLQSQTNTSTTTKDIKNNKTSQKHAITETQTIIIDDEEDEDLKQALQNSLQEVSTPKSSSPTSSEPNTNAKVTSKTESIKIEWAWYLNRLPGFAREANTPSLSLRDIVQEGFDSALITTYELDLQWLLTKLPVLTKVPVTMVHGEKSPEALPRPPVNITYHKPNLPLQWGVHHGKMFVLYYPDHVRVAVSTANLIMIDYERKSQGIWMQDFPKKKQQDSPSCDFESTLVDYVSRLGLNTTKIKQYDYSTANVVLITSVPGYHKGALMNKYGHMKLRAALQTEKLHSKFRDASIACQFSSTGSLSKDWLLEEMMGSLTANGGFYGPEEKKAEKKEEKKDVGDKKRSRDTRDTIQNNMQLIWPTVEFVRNSLDGWASGGSLCFPMKNLKSFLKESNLFHSYTSFQGREHVPPHIKTYSRYLPDGELAWNYLTSANFSKAAMGELQKEASQLMIRHYEIGVLFVPSLYSRGQGLNPKFLSLQGFISANKLDNQTKTTNSTAQTTNSNSNSNSNSTSTSTNPNLNPPNSNSNSTNSNTNTTQPLVGFPLPYTLPPKIYAGTDEPWVWDVPRSGQDLYGKRWLC